MRNLLITLLIVGKSNWTFGQVLIALLFGDKLQSDKLEFGLMTGPTFSNITNIDNSVKPGFELGLYFNIKLSDNWFFHPEAIPKLSLGGEGISPYETGTDSLDVLFYDGSVKRTIKTIGLPLLMRYRIKNRWFAEAGPQIDWMLKVKDVFETTANDNKLTYSQDTSSSFTNFGFGLAGGVEYKLKKDKGMGLSVRYYKGLTDIDKLNSGSQTNQSWFIIVSIPIGVGKAERSNN